MDGDEVPLPTSPQRVSLLDGPVARSELSNSVNPGGKPGHRGVGSGAHHARLLTASRVKLDRESLPETQASVELDLLVWFGSWCLSGHFHTVLFHAEGPVHPPT